MQPTFRLRPLGLPDMDRVAAIHRAAFDDRLPWLTGLHSPEEDRAFYNRHVFPRCTLQGAEAEGDLVGFVARHAGWIAQFYILPGWQGRGVGSALLDWAKAGEIRLELWTFQRNLPARRFYEARGFHPVRETDGSGNEEREPDILYCWDVAADG